MEEERKWCVYCHTNKINGKKYIGITSYKPEYRWNNGKAYPKNKYFTSSIKKYGWDNFEHTILEDNLLEKEAKEKEIYYIKEYKTFVGFKDSSGYNLTTGGEGMIGIKHTEETKEKIRRALKGRKFSEEHLKNLKGHGSSRSGENNPNYGINPQKYWSKESIESAKQKWANNMNKRWEDENYRNKVREATKTSSIKRWENEDYIIAHSGKNHFLYGEKRSQEVRDKISKTRKERLDSGQIITYKHENQEGIRVICEGVEYISIASCARNYGITKERLRNWLSGKYKMPKEWVEKGLKYREDK